MIISDQFLITLGVAMLFGIIAPPVLMFKAYRHGDKEFKLKCPHIRTYQLGKFKCCFSQ